MALSKDLDTWAWVLIILASILVGLLLLRELIRIWARAQYKWMKHNPPSACDIDAFVDNAHEKNPVNAVKCVLIYKSQVGNRKANLEPIPLETIPSPHVPNLLISRRQSSVDAADPNTVKPVTDLFATQQNNKTPIVVATIRMGFGHHRLAYSTASWALETGHPTIFHDLLGIQSAESELLKNTDSLYSKFSRMASELGGPIEKMWGSAMMQGDADALRVAAMTAAHLQNLLTGYPKDTPIITTHQTVALTAAAAGFTNVINLVVDNWPQWFLTAPKTLNLVQGPVNYQCFLKMGVPPDQLQWAGHWCPRDMVVNIDVDCQRRIQRAKQVANNIGNESGDRKPIRILIPVGGAGAQRKFIISFVRELADYVKAGKVQLFLNAGDHEHMKTAFLQVLDECGLDFETKSDIEGVRNFQNRLLTATYEPNKSVTLFAFDEYFPAVATTDILCRVSDILCCKPSELAFYCIPKLHIRRVGDHEAASAKRASELGDGTLEAREIEDAVQYLDMFLESPDLLVSMNQAIIENNKIGIYDGCRRAVELVLERANANNHTIS